MQELTQIAAQISPESSLVSASSGFPWYGWVAIAAILSVFITGGVTETIKCVLKHRERMAMIRMGMNPDFSPEDSRPGAAVEKEALYEVGEL
jgi:hypothetical protein